MALMTRKRLRNVPFAVAAPAAALATAAVLLVAGETMVAQNNFPKPPGIERLDAALDALIAPGATIEVLAGGYDWSEGPVWVKDGGYLLFSDIPPNRIHRWKEGEGAKLYLTPSGYTGSEKRGGEVGSNGLTLDRQGRLVLAQHGDRRIARMDAPLSSPQPKFTTLADRYAGARFNSPNDLVFRSNGDLYFTDPAYGMEKQWDDPKREMNYAGVFRRSGDGTVTLLTKEMTRPNGLAFSPTSGVSTWHSRTNPQRSGGCSTSRPTARLRTAACCSMPPRWARRARGCRTASRSTPRATCSRPARAAC